MQLQVDDTMARARILGYPPERGWRGQHVNRSAAFHGSLTLDPPITRTSAQPTGRFCSSERRCKMVDKLSMGAVNERGDDGKTLKVHKKPFCSNDRAELSTHYIVDIMVLTSFCS